MNNLRNASLLSAILIGLVVAGLPPIALKAVPGHSVPVVSASSTPPLHRTFWLHGHYLIGWNGSSPGPFISVVSSDLVTLLLKGDDGFTHSWFLDANNNFVNDTGEVSSIRFSSTITYLNFTFTPVIGTNIASAGNVTYRCAFHPFVMFGTFRVLPEQLSAAVGSSATLDTSKVTTTGSVILDMRSLKVSGSVSVTATDAVSGATTFAKTYTILGLQMLKASGSTTFRVSFLLNVAVLPYSSSSDIATQLQGLTFSASTILTRQLDLNTQGTVNAVDASTAGAAYGTMIGGPNYNPKADFDANGAVNVIDVSIFGAYWQAQVFY